MTDQIRKIRVVLARVERRPLRFEGMTPMVSLLRAASRSCAIPRLALSSASRPRVRVGTILAVALYLCSAGTSHEELRADERLFRERVAPILQKRCVSCHSDDLRKGGLSLQTAEGLKAGGESGPTLVAGQPDASPLIDQLVGDQPAMPKLGGPLSAGEVDAIRRWIASGATWPAGLRLEERPAADLDWWSLKPLAAAPPPRLSADDEAHVRQPLDRFILARLRREGLAPSPPADRRTLIRRLAFDLTGLPPAPEEVEAFVANEHPQAYEQLVDRYLDSPRYGERWARHWLDIVHYGDTHGYDKDKLRPNAWPYRDYVIRALNEDKPYARFVQEQLAGDQLFPGTTDGLVALGFIAAGPWDFISHVEVPESKIDGKIARNLDRDDMVVNTMNAFCGVTVQCARCHHHKFDPISMEDYYRLQATFAAVDRADQPFDADPAIAARRADLRQRQRANVERLDATRRQIATLGGATLAALDRKVDEAKKSVVANGTKPPEHGYHSGIEASDQVAKWVQVDLGAPRAIAAVELIGCHDDFNNIGAGFGFPPRYRIEAADDAAFTIGLVKIDDQSRVDVPNPGIEPRRIACDLPAKRFVRVTATRLAPRQRDFIFALAELRVLDGEGRNWALRQPVEALDSIEAGPRWGRANLVDDIYPRGPAPNAKEALAKAVAERAEWLQRTIPSELRDEERALGEQQQSLERELATLPPPQLAYIGAVYQGSGNFVGTGGAGGRPRPIHILKRGDVRNPLAVVEPGVPPLFPFDPARFAVAPEAPEGARRVALAQWITDRDNPLTWRCIVNRVWQYHFGRGLVDSPSDLGRMGQKPTHPELLDWLAVEFRDQGQSLKQLHRLICTSATYRQSAQGNPDCERVDAQNTLLWRMNRRKLEAEAVRDSILWVSGKLDLAMGGPGFQDFVIERPEHSPHFEYRLHDPEDARTHRRSVYRFLVRSQPQPFMTTFDCADPSMSVDKRSETINSLQALALLNNKLTIAMARHFANRVERLADDDRQRTRQAFRMALSREPTDEELDTLAAYATQHGLANLCRVLFNLNEFAFVD